MKEGVANIVGFCPILKGESAEKPTNLATPWKLTEGMGYGEESRTPKNPAKVAGQARTAEA
jgi:hypothetical protein